MELSQKFDEMKVLFGEDVVNEMIENLKPKRREKVLYYNDKKYKFDVKGVITPKLATELTKIINDLPISNFEKAIYEAKKNKAPEQSVTDYLIANELMTEEDILKYNSNNYVDPTFISKQIHFFKFFSLIIETSSLEIDEILVKGIMSDPNSNAYKQSYEFYLEQDWELIQELFIFFRKRVGI